VFNNNQNSLNIEGSNSKANVFNNVFANSESAVSVTNAETKLFNNIFYMFSASRAAVEYNGDKLASDNNIYYPEQNAFLKISGKLYNSLSEFQKLTEFDAHSFNLDPLFVNPDNGNYAVETYSPAINSGKNVNLNKDFYGEDVPFAGITDIGISENNGKNVGKDMVLPELIVYPNPSTGYVNIDADFTNAIETTALSGNTGYVSEIRISDMNGKLILSKIIEHSEVFFHQNLDLTGIADGIYSIILKIAEKTISGKLIIHK
jgi:hypothetical protein